MLAIAYLEVGLDSALHDEGRSGRPIDFDDQERLRIVVMVCSQPQHDLKCKCILRG